MSSAAIIVRQTDPGEDIEAGTVQDVQDLSGMLREQGASVTTLDGNSFTTKERGSLKDSVLRQVERKIGSHATVVQLFYTGHGGADTGELCLARGRGRKGRDLAPRELFELWREKARPDQKLVLGLDSCYSGAWVSQLKAMEGRGELDGCQIEVMSAATGIETTEGGNKRGCLVSHLTGQYGGVEGVDGRGLGADATGTRVQYIKSRAFRGEGEFEKAGKVKVYMRQDINTRTTKEPWVSLVEQARFLGLGNIPALVAEEDSKAVEKEEHGARPDMRSGFAKSLAGGKTGAAAQEQVKQRFTRLLNARQKKFDKFKEENAGNGWGSDEMGRAFRGGDPVLGWNDFRSSRKGRGYSPAEMSAEYRKYQEALLLLEEGAGGDGGASAGGGGGAGATVVVTPSRTSASSGRGGGGSSSSSKHRGGTQLKKDGTPDMRFASNRAAAAMKPRALAQELAGAAATPPAPPTASRAATAARHGVREPCPYGGKCYRTGAEHLAQFSHPPRAGASGAGRGSSKGSSTVADGHRRLKKDGTPDMRFKANRATSAGGGGGSVGVGSGGRGGGGGGGGRGGGGGSSSKSSSNNTSNNHRRQLKGDGTADMRYKANRTASGGGGGGSDGGGGGGRGSSSNSRPLKKDGTPDMRFNANRANGGGGGGSSYNDSSSYDSGSSYRSSSSSSSSSYAYSGGSASSGGPLKKDGTPDMRYKANR